MQFIITYIWLVEYTSTILDPQMFRQHLITFSTHSSLKSPFCSFWKQDIFVLLHNLNDDKKYISLYSNWVNMSDSSVHKRCTVFCDGKQSNAKCHPFVLY